MRTVVHCEAAGLVAVLSDGLVTLLDAESLEGHVLPGIKVCTQDYSPVSTHPFCCSAPVAGDQQLPNLADSCCLGTPQNVVFLVPELGCKSNRAAWNLDAAWRTVDRSKRTAWQVSLTHIAAEVQNGTAIAGDPMTGFPPRLAIATKTGKRLVRVLFYELLGGGGNGLPRGATAMCTSQAEITESLSIKVTPSRRRR